MTNTFVIEKNIQTLNQVYARFNLSRSENDQFFTEWEDLEELSGTEKQTLDRIKEKYLYQRAEAPLGEDAIKMVVLSPLLDLAGFYDPPFRFQAETPVEIIFAEEDEILRGRIDALVIQDQFWVILVESKRTTLNVEVALPQTLTYMMASPHSDRPVFGMITSGGSFVFVKLLKQTKPQYDISEVFSLLPCRNELYSVLQILKRIGKDL